MGNTKTNALVVELSIIVPPLPEGTPQPEELQPGPALVRVWEFVRTHIVAIPECLFPEIRTTTDPDPNMTRRRRGMRHALVIGPPPLVFPPTAAQEMPIQCQRPLVVVVSAICSSAVLIWLSRLIGPVNLPASILPTDLPVYLTRVVDVVNRHVGHVPGNVAARVFALWNLD
ncbi:hypothetical protein RSOLAG22IIIB_07919 [Rhizoctonia solani]|uniref:Uncharacterized protein n=1 Tax=Rhizoctonia solani TaxID=456999 RepID=A0A0K6FQ99_9AGAM|nr:hypothetical protein RSOLAG22IIIB_07919 [Rhizoctonia solani]